jgi:hypothetical protein
MRRQTIKERMDPALTALLEPGDRIVAGFEAQTGASPNWNGIWAYPSIALFIYAIWYTATSPLGRPSELAGVFLPGLPVLAATISLVMGHRQKTLFFAATGRFLICYELAGSGHPFRPRFRVPLEAVQLTSRPAWTWRFPVEWRALEYAAPGTGAASVRFHVHRRWRDDAARLLTQVQAGGGLVQAGQQPPLGPEALALPEAAQD